MESNYIDYLSDHIGLFSRLNEMEPTIVKAGELLINTLKTGNNILICGNGGSASDAQHFAAEIVGKFKEDRKALPAIALTTNTLILTAIGNDYGYNVVFSRQIEAIGLHGDTLIGISTSGNSKNVILAAKTAKRLGIRTIGLIGRDGGKLKPLVEEAVIIPHSDTARIQEAHIFILHFWAALIGKELFNNN